MPNTLVREDDVAKILAKLNTLGYQICKRCAARLAKMNANRKAKPQ